MNRKDTLPKMEDLIKGRVYKIYSRNLSIGVWDGDKEFIGIRYKFGSRYLFGELHYDACTSYGTVIDAVDTGIDVPSDIEIRCNLDTTDRKTKRLVEFDRPILDGGKGWYFKDTGEPSESILPVSMMNRDLFNLLDSIGAEQMEK